MCTKSTLFIAFTLLSFLSISQYSYDWGFSPKNSHPGGGDVVGNANAVDNLNNVYVVGRFEASADFHPGASLVTRTAHGQGDGYIVKYDSTGNFLWVKTIAGLGDVNILEIVVDNSGAFYVSGSFSLSADFDPSLNNAFRTAEGGYDLFVAKYDLNGTFLWVNAMGSAGGTSNTESANALAIDKTQNVCVIGRFNATVDFDPSGTTNNLTSIGTNDVFLAKYDVNGNYLWANSFDASQGNAVAVDTANNICISGAHAGTVDFDPGAGVANLTAGNGIDIYLAKYDSNGNYMWAKGLECREGTDLAIDDLNNIYLLGHNRTDSDVDPSAGTVIVSCPFGQDVILAKYNENGGYLWVKKVTSSGVNTDNAYSKSITLDESNNVYVAGRFSASSGSFLIMSFPGVGNGGEDIFFGAYTSTGSIFIPRDKIGGTNNDGANGICVSSTGKVSITGYFEGSVDFDPSAGVNSLTASTYPSTLKNAFHAQYSGPPNNILEFTNQIGDLHEEIPAVVNQNERGDFILTDAVGNSIALGTIDSKVDFMPGDSTFYLDPLGDAIYLAKYNPNGELMWAKSIRSGGIVLEDVAMDDFGNLFIVGQSDAFQIAFDSPGSGVILYPSNSGADGFIVKFDANGDYVWANVIEGNYDSKVKQIEINSVGNPIVTGTFGGTLDFNPQGPPLLVSAIGFPELFIAEYDATGSAVWVKTLVGGGQIDCLALDETDSIYLAGKASTTLDFDAASGTAVLGNTNTFIAKYSPSGDFFWVKELTGGTMTQRKLKVNSDKLYLLGSLNGSMDSDPSAAINQLNSVGGYDPYLIQFDLNGNHQWAVIFGGSDSEYGRDIDFYGNNEIFLTGHFLGNTDLDPSPNVASYSAGTTNDVFVSCLDSLGVFQWAIATEGSGIAYGNGLGVDLSGNIFLTGRFENEIVLNPPQLDVLVAGYLYDAMIVKYRRPCVNVSSTYPVSTCGSYTWIDGNTYATNNNTATHTVVTPGACDTLYTLDLTINGANSGTDVISACDSYLWIDGNTYTSSNNTATFTLTNAAGCDSIVMLDLTINNSTTGTDVITACDSYMWIDGNTYTASNNTATVTLTNAVGCDSVVTLDLTINNSSTGTDVQTACDSYTWIDGNTYTSSNNTATVILTNAVGCDSIVTLDLTINNSSTGTDVITACDSYTWIDGNTYTSSNNTATFTLSNAAGCDSIVTLDLTINNSTTGTDVITACNSYTWIDGNTYTSSNNTATVTLTNAVGCDSVVTLDLTINNSTTATDVITSCDSYYTWINGVTYIANNNVAVHTITNAAGCDSVITLNLTFLTAATGIDVQAACGSFTWIDGNTYAASTNTPTYSIVGGGANGCDSIVTLNLTILNESFGTDVITACESYTWIDGNTYTASNNTATWTLTNAAGCDSIVTLDLTINNSSTGTDVITACDTHTWIDGNTYTASNNTATWTLTNAAGCDSIVTLDLTINNSNTGTDVQSACDSYTWIDGNTYTASNNTATFTLTNAAGCDSIVTLDLTINNSNTGMDVQSACDSYTWIDGNTYTASNNTATFTLTNAAGCDSIVTLDLTINNSNTGMDVQSACDSYTWIDGNTYTASNNTATFTLTNATGCDSIVTLDLTINNSNTGTDVQTACDSYTWIDGNTYTASNNTATWTLTNAAGCDSIVTLDLTINNSNTGTDVQSACDSYTWIDGNTYTASNNTATWTLTNAAGCDSIVTLDLTINNSNTGTDVQSACDSYTWIDGNTYTASNNTATFTLTNATGCDSIVTLDLTINNSNTGTDLQTACDSYTWIDGNTYTASNNTATWTLTNAAGCDSVVSLDLTILAPATGTDVQTACGSFTWMDGTTYYANNNSATFVINGGAVNGCDSIVTLNLTVNPMPNTDIDDQGITLVSLDASASYQWLDCNNDFVQIPGETFISFTPDTTGSYAVKLDLAGCIDTSVCFFVDYSDLKEISDVDFKLYPNPTNELFTVEFADAQGKVEFKLLSTTGQLIESRIEQSFSSVQFNITSEPGVYFLELTFEDERKAILPVIKQ